MDKVMLHNEKYLNILKKITLFVRVVFGIAFFWVLCSLIYSGFNI